MVTKYIVTGNVIEVYTYDKYVAGTGGKREKEKTKNAVDEACLLNYKNHCQVRLNNIRRLACSNFNRNSTFVTLTFDDAKVDFDIRNVNVCRYHFKKFIQRLKYTLKNQNLKYLAVVEFQDTNDRGAIHYHVLFDIPFIDFYVLTDVWGMGHCWINKIDHVDNVGAYLVKYICKDGGDERLMGKNAYLHSKNLIQPESYILLDDESAGPEFYKIDTLISNLDVIYECDYNTELMGHVNYKQYNVERGYICQ